jgi:hypothetical protein
LIAGSASSQRLLQGSNPRYGQGDYELNSANSMWGMQ